MTRIVGRLALVASLVAIALPATLGGSNAVEAATATVVCTPQPSGVATSAPPMLSYTPISPLRLVDTRNNIGGVAAPLERGCTMIVDVGSDIPSNAQAVALSARLRGIPAHM